MLALSRVRRFVGLLLVGLGAFLVLHAQERPSDVLKRAGDDSPPSASDAPDEPDRADEADATEEAGSESAAPSSPAETAATASETDEAGGERGASGTEGVANVVHVPVRDIIAAPNEYVLRRALKTAISEGAHVLVLDIDTPGGSVATLLEMMEHIDRFNAQGMTIAYINDEAISAGALLSAVANEIWYAPKAVIGSAGVVTGTGEDVNETMKQKIESFIQAKVRALSAEHPYRGDVIRAMMDQDFELVVDGKVISEEGRMLNLTANEAMERYGEPPTALFGDGIAEDLDALLDARFGAGNWELNSLEVTWSEELATYLTKIGPLLVAFGILGLFVEFKTPGFGIFGIGGLSLLAVVFATNYITGLAGWEPFLVLLLGLVLVIVDIFVLPGTFVLGSIGLVCIFGSLLWSLSDVWPTFDGGVDVEMENVVHAAYRLSLGLLISMVGIVLFWRFLPRMGLFDRFVLADGGLETVAYTPETSSTVLPEPGALGVVTRSLRPSGEVEIEGRRYEARVITGTLDRGERIVVVRHVAFGLEVASAEGPTG